MRYLSVLIYLSLRRFSITCRDTDVISAALVGKRVIAGQIHFSMKILMNLLVIKEVEDEVIASMIFIQSSKKKPELLLLFNVIKRLLVLQLTN